MVDQTPLQNAIQIAVFLAMVSAIFFAQLLPLNPGPGGIVGPDVLLLLTVAWLLRNPAAVPVALIAAVFLIADFLFMRPPGLWALVVVLMSEAIRGRQAGYRDISFAVEWLMISAFITLATFAHLLLQLIFIVDQPGLGQSLIRLLATLLCYPIVVVAGARAFGVRKHISGEFNPLGVKS